MRISSIDLRNIGPFKEGHLTFIPDGEVVQQPPVTIITGENGTGKTIILDAIRGLLGGYKLELDRNITREEDFHASIAESDNGVVRQITSRTLLEPYLETNHTQWNENFELGGLGTEGYWVVDYWTSKLATDRFSIDSLSSPKLEDYRIRSLTGIHQNAEVTQLVTFFDYLKSSENPTEQKLGKAIYTKLKLIFSLCLNDGELKHVNRIKLLPVIEQNGREVTLDKLSSGNLYLVQRMVSMLGKMYAVNVLNDKPLEELCLAPGLLLIDEAENHLHPKWQKTFINNVLEVFPNLQIILTTHSPFIVASVENARIYVCESRLDHSVIVDQTDEYANKPIDEILLTPLFDTQPFNAKISRLIAERKKAVATGNHEQQKRIEQQLKSINPEYFSYFDVDDLLESITK